MKGISIVEKFWSDMNNQNWSNLESCFCDDAKINWNNTNECFDKSEFIRVNSKYPGDWEIKIIRLEEINNTVISVVKILLLGDNMSFHANSFFEFEDDKIKLLNEYFSEDSDPPKWRVDMKIGKAIE